MTKALLVLAECVDSRTGKRFMPDETFDPAPTVSQAQRLVSANCLPADSVAAAEKAAVAKDREDERIADVTKAKADLATAQFDLAAAETALSTAEDGGRAEAQKVVDAAQKAVEKAAAVVAKLGK